MGFGQILGFGRVLGFGRFLGCGRSLDGLGRALIVVRHRNRGADRGLFRLTAFATCPHQPQEDPVQTDPATTEHQQKQAAGAQRPDQLPTVVGDEDTIPEVDLDQRANGDDQQAKGGQRHDQADDQHAAGDDFGGRGEDGGQPRLGYMHLGEERGGRVHAAIPLLPAVRDEDDPDHHPRDQGRDIEQPAFHAASLPRLPPSSPSSVRKCHSLPYLDRYPGWITTPRDGSMAV